MDNPPFPPAESTGGALSSFTLFPELPIELRRAIWNFSIRPRVVRMFQDPDAERSVHFYPFRVRMKVPPILHVNQESRVEGLKVYKIQFANLVFSPVYFSPSIDTLFLGDKQTFSTFTERVDKSGWELTYSGWKHSYNLVKEFMQNNKIISLAIQIDSKLEQAFAVDVLKLEFNFICCYLAELKTVITIGHHLSDHFKQPQYDCWLQNERPSSFGYHRLQCRPLVHIHKTYEEFISESSDY